MNTLLQTIFKSFASSLVTSPAWLKLSRHDQNLKIWWIKMSTFSQRSLFMVWTTEAIIYWYLVYKLDFCWLFVHFFIIFWLYYGFICPHSYYLSFWSKMSTFPVKIVRRFAGSHLFSCLLAYLPYYWSGSSEIRLTSAWA